MRQLNPVALHEQFAGSGIYRFEQNGRSLEVTEAWTLHRLPDHSLFVRADHDGRNTEVSILFEALLNPQWKVDRFNVRLDDPSGKQVRQLRANYLFFDEHVEVSWQTDDMIRREETIQLPSGTVIYPGMLVFVGDVIRQVERQQDQQAPVFFVDLQHISELEAIKGQIRNCSVRQIEVENSTAEQAPVQGYQFSGMGFSEQAKFWLDGHDMLVNYSDEQKHVVLTRYAPFSKKRS